MHSKKDSSRISLQEDYIKGLEQNLSICRGLNEKRKEQIQTQKSIIQLNQKEIQLLKLKAQSNQSIINKLEDQVAQNNKVNKRKIIGWKIATGVSIGVSVAVITGAAIILSR